MQTGDSIQFTVTGTITLSSGEQFQSASNLRLQWRGLPTQTYILQTSPDLLYWSDYTNTVADLNGFGECVDSNLPSGPDRFYRLKSTGP